MKSFINLEIHSPFMKQALGNETIEELRSDNNFLREKLNKLFKENVILKNQLFFLMEKNEYSEKTNSANSPVNLSKKET